MTTESGSRRRSQEPISISRGAPARVASSRPIRNDAPNFPVLVRATGLPLNSRTAQPTPATPRTRVRSVSLSAFVWSQYSVIGSMIQISASVTSRIWLAGRLRMLAKIEVWFSSRNVQNAIAKTRPKYLARSPVSMRKATKFIGCLLRPLDDDDHPIRQKNFSPANRIEVELLGALQESASASLVGKDSGNRQCARHPGHEHPRPRFALLLRRAGHVLRHPVGAFLQDLFERDPSARARRPACQLGREGGDGATVR